MINYLQKQLSQKSHRRSLYSKKTTSWTTASKSSHRSQRKTFTNFTEEHLCWSLFLVKLQV